MAIQPIHFAASELKVPQADYSWLSNLVPNIQQTRANAMKIDEGQRRQGVLAEMGKLNPNDPNFAQQAAALALRLGDVGGAASMINNAAELKLKREEAERDAADINRRMPTTAPAATPGTPAPVSLAPSLAQPPIFQTPQVAPGIPALPVTPGGGPSIAPPRTGSILQPQPVAGTPPIMAQNTTQNLMRGYMAAPDKSTVRFEGVNSDLLQHANAVGNELYGKLNRPLYVTSAKDSVHTRGSAHYDGNALDLRTRDLNVQQRQAIVAGFRARGLNAVDEGDHIHVSTPRGGAVPPTGGGPGTVTASLQGRGPISGTTVAAASRGPIQTAALDPANFNIGNPAVASDISPTPMARTAAVGNQAAGGPANVTNPGGEQQASLLPNPTPLQATPLPPPNAAPSMSLAALGGAPAGTIGAPPAGPPGASNASPVQLAQAAPYSPPFAVNAPQAAPALPQRAPVPQQAPAVAPQAPPVARGAVSGSPMELIPPDALVRLSGSKRYGEVARAEIARRSALVAEQEKPTELIKNWREAQRGGYKGSLVDFQAQSRADQADIARYNWMKANGYQGTPEDYMRDYGGGQRITVGGEKINKREEAFIESMKAIKKTGDESFISKTLITNMRALPAATGLEAVIKHGLGELGIPTQGLDQVQALNSLLDFMVPSQPRAPGSQSEFEAKTIRSSLPRLITQPGGKELIMNILEAVSDLNNERRNVAGNYMAEVKNPDGTLYTAAQAEKDMQALREKGIELARTAAKLARGEGEPPLPAGEAKALRDMVDEFRTKK